MSWYISSFPELRAVVLTMAVYAAALCLLAVWAGLSRRHWFLRALVVGIGLQSLMPIRAYEPLLLFLFVMPLTWTVIALLRRWLDQSVASRVTVEERPAENTKARSRVRTVVEVGVVLFVLLSLIPVHAYVPLLLLLFVVLLTRVVIILLRRWLGQSPAGERVIVEERPAQNTKMRSRFRTLVVIGVVLFGLATAAFEHLSGRFPTFPSWYEQLLLTTLVGAFIIAMMYEFGFRSRWEPREVATGNVEDKASGWRFGMRDLLLWMVVVAAVSRMFATAINQRLLLDWAGMLVSGLCIVLLNVLCCVAVLVRRRRTFALALLPAAIGGVAAIHTWVLPDWITLGHIIWSHDPVQNFGLFLVASLLFTLLLLVAICLFRMAGCFELTALLHLASPASARLGAVAFVGMCLAIFGPLTMVYWRMLDEIPMPQHKMPPTNSYPQLMAAVNKLAKLNPSEVSLEENRDLGASPAQIKRLKSVYDDLMSALEKPAYVPLDLEHDSPDEFDANLLPTAIRLRLVARTFNRETEQAVMNEKFDEAAVYGVANMRLGTIQQSGGLAFHSLVGIAIENVGIAQLSKVRRDLSVDKTRKVLRDLEAFEQAREPFEVTVRRDNMWHDRSYTWRYRLSKTAARVLTSNRFFNQFDAAPSNHTGVAACARAMRRRDAEFQLLKTDLAIRLFQHDEGRLPENLEALVGRYLSSLPVDPFSERPLVYRQVEDGFVLYSVWRDGVDNGGNFGSRDVYHGYATGFDLDLDAEFRQKSSVKSTTGQ